MFVVSLILIFVCASRVAMALDDDVMDEDEEYLNDVNDLNNLNSNNNIAAALAGLTNLFATGVISCEQELIPPEESCCHPPGENDSPNAPHECFAPPMAEEKHPWESSQALSDLMQTANRALSVTEFEKLVYPSVAPDIFNKEVPLEQGIALDGAALPTTKALVIDTRCSSEFIAGHVPNAVFGGGSTDQFDKFIGTVHSEHNIPVVFIPSSEDPKVIEETGQRLAVAGLTNLHGYLKGGMSAWVAAGRRVVKIDRWNASVLAKKIKESIGTVEEEGLGAPVRKTISRQSLVDLREPCASDSSKLPNSENIPVTETVMLEVYHRAQHETDPSHPLVLYCSNGFRSLMVASALKAQYPKINVISLEVGFDELVEHKDIKELMKRRP